MTQEEMNVADNVVVQLEYELLLDDGEIIDQSDNENPLEFLQGSGQIIPGLEKELYGMTVGEEKQVVVEPADGYGEYDREDVGKVSRDVFPKDLELEEGLSLRMRDSQGGESYQATVLEIQPESVVLDFNHPLAGEKLHFNVKVIDLRSATREEIAHRHAHGADHPH
jgi:FKBP-type peptidyl-prolyl cis-trans isomerase SlyD